jgi:hypothetical protein
VSVIESLSQRLSVVEHKVERAREQAELNRDLALALNELAVQQPLPRYVVTVKIWRWELKFYAVPEVNGDAASR